VEFPSTGEGVQPDIVVIAAARRGIIDDDWIRGAPDIVVEILSPGTQRRDRGVKLKLYDSQGVGEYWIVDPTARTVEVWRFEDGSHCERFSDRLPVRLAGATLGEIDLAEVFRED
jgi:Uma2 family endonuclease